MTHQNKFRILISFHLMLCVVLALSGLIRYNTAVLLFLALGGVIMIIDPLLKPVVKRINNKVAKEQKIIDTHKRIAQKGNKKGYTFGPNKQHVVWATSKLAATKIYNSKVVPLAKANPKKEYYFISSVCNNLKYS